MPKLTQDALAWFYNLQTVLKEDFDIDTTNPADLGRVHVCRFFEAEMDEDKNFVPIKPYKDDLDLVAGDYYTLEDKYAFAPINPETDTYKEPVKEESPAELLGIQKGFYVDKDENGQYQMHSELSEEQFMYLYEKAKNGLLYANGPKHPITVNDESKESAFLCVGRNHEVVKGGLDFASAAQLSKEQMDVLLKKHPEFMGNDEYGRPYTANSYEVTHTANILLGEYSKTADPARLYRKYGHVISRLQNRSAENEEYSGAHYAEYINEFWRKKDRLDEYTAMENREDDFYATYGLRDLFDLNGAGYDITGRSGLDRIYVYDEKEQKLQSITKDMPADLPDEEFERQIKRRMTKAKNQETLYAYLKKDGEETLYKLGGEGHTPRLTEAEAAIAKDAANERNLTTSFGMKDVFEKHGSTFDLDSEEGIDRLFYYDEAQKQLVNITDGLPEGGKVEERRNQIRDRIMDAKKNGTLFAYFKDEEGKEKLSQISGKGMKLEAKEARFPEPREPGFIAKLFHKIRDKWFKKDFENYEKARFFKAYMDTVTTPASWRTFKDSVKAPEEKQKPKTRTREQVYEKIAGAILDVKKEIPIPLYLKVMSTTKEDVIKGAYFKEFVQDPKNAADIQKAMEGKPLNWQTTAKNYFKLIKAKDEKPKAEAAGKENEKEFEINTKVHKQDKGMKIG